MSTSSASVKEGSATICPFSRYAPFAVISKQNYSGEGQKLSASGSVDDIPHAQTADTSSTAVSADITGVIGGERRQSYVPAVERQHVNATRYA